MRISDWSSDVCSSDLAPPGLDLDAGRGLLVELRDGDRAVLLHRNVCDVRTRALHRCSVRGRRTGGRREDEERGASAREPSAPRGGRKDGAHHFEVIFSRSTLPEAGTSQLSWPAKPAPVMFSLPRLPTAAIPWQATAGLPPPVPPDP